MSDEKTVMLTPEELEKIRKGSEEESDATAKGSGEQEQKGKSEE